MKILKQLLTMLENMVLGASLDRFSENAIYLVHDDNLPHH